MLRYTNRLTTQMMVVVEVIGPEAVRPSLHSLLHLARAVRDVGECDRNYLRARCQYASTGGPLMFPRRAMAD